MGTGRDGDGNWERKVMATVRDLDGNWGKGWELGEMGMGTGRER